MAKITITIEDGAKPDGSPTIHIDAESDNKDTAHNTPAEDFAVEVMSVIYDFADAHNMAPPDPNSELN